MVYHFFEKLLLQFFIWKATMVYHILPFWYFGLCSVLVSSLDIYFWFSRTLNNIWFLRFWFLPPSSSQSRLHYYFGFLELFCYHFVTRRTTFWMSLLTLLGIFLFVVLTLSVTRYVNFSPFHNGLIITQSSYLHSRILTQFSLIS